MKIKKLHRWDIPPTEARILQERLSKRLKLKFPKIEVSRIAACDVSFFRDKKEARSCVVIFSYPQLDLLSEVVATDRVRYPYIPGLLTFREGPLLLKALKRIKEKVDLLLFDGQGIAHPRRMGIASHIGLWLDKPTIGCAKSYLYGRFKPPKLNEHITYATERSASYKCEFNPEAPKEPKDLSIEIASPLTLKMSRVRNDDLVKKGTSSYIYDRDNKRIGACLCTRDNVRPVYVSPGHKMDLDTAVKIVLGCVKNFRIPEPLRVAHIRANV